ncbi:hypothetical protein RhiirC2_823376, partial [Rhizophagus irregularis]
ILPPPRPDTSAPSGDRPLSPTSTASAPNKRSRIVSDDAMNVDITSPSAPAPNLTSTIPSGLPVNRVPVITQPPPTNTSLESSIHAHPLPVSTNPSPNDKDAKLSDEAKSLFVTNIPLFLSKTQVRQAFSRYGTVIKCKLTPRKHYYNGHIQFSSADAVTQFNDIWAIICLEADLLEIASQVNAKALNVSLSISSYKPKPYVYLNFSSFDTLEAAKEMTVAFRGKGLTWYPPNEVHTLCHVCGRSGCSPSVCSPHPTRKVDDRLNKLYSRFNAGPRRGHQDSRQSRDKSNTRSRSRSTSRS